MTVLYENTRRAKRARLGMLGASVWTIGWFYWAYTMSIGGFRPGAIGVVLVIGVLPLVALYFYSLSYVVRIEREGDTARISTLTLYGQRSLDLPVSKLSVSVEYSDAKRTSANGIVIRAAGRRLPFIVDLQAENVQSDAILALAGRSEGTA
jgi:hypothetical protein